MKPLPHRFFEKPVLVVGRILDIPDHRFLVTQYLVAIQSINDKKMRGKLQVSWYRPKEIGHPGESWQWLLKLKPIHGSNNPGGIDAVRWARMQGILASAYVMRSVKNRRLSTAMFSMDAFREQVQHAIRHSIHSKTLASLITAFSIGSTRLLSSDTWSVFQRTGTSHLIAISGLHVGLVFMLVYWVLNILCRAFPGLLLRYPAQYWASAGALLFIYAYGSFVGFALPAQRAIIMLTIGVLSFLFSWPWSVWQRLFLAAGSVLALQPMALFSASFWLSFMAVFWLSYAALSERRYWGVKIMLTLGLLPIILYCFSEFSIFSLLINTVAIPWVTILVVPLCLLASIIFIFSQTASAVIWSVAAKTMHPLWCLLQYLSRVHFSQWLHPIHHLSLVLSSMMGFLLLFAPKGLPLYQLGLILLCPLLISFSPRPKEAVVWVTVLDVGQGLSAVIQTAHHLLVYDAGPRFPTGFSAGRSVLIPFLKRNGLTRIDRLMISHGDNDHIGGSFYLVRHFPVASILSSVTRSRWHRRFQPCYAHQEWQWDGVTFRVLWPPIGYQYSGNNSSCVLRISVGHRALLLTGDIEKLVEKRLLHNKSLLRSDALIVPHHGSASSSSQAFVRAVGAQWVIIPVGYQNRYHLPASRVRARYLASGAHVMSTAEQGAVSLEINQKKCFIRSTSSIFN